MSDWMNLLDDAVVEGAKKTRKTKPTVVCAGCPFRTGPEVEMIYNDKTYCPACWHTVREQTTPNWNAIWKARDILKMKTDPYYIIYHNDSISNKPKTRKTKPKA
jgi:hypothetical protein